MASLRIASRLLRQNQIHSRHICQPSICIVCRCLHMTQSKRNGKFFRRNSRRKKPLEQHSKDGTIKMEELNKVKADVKASITGFRANFDTVTRALTSRWKPEMILAASTSAGEIKDTSASANSNATNTLSDQQPIKELNKQDLHTSPSTTTETGESEHNSEQVKETAETPVINDKSKIMPKSNEDEVKLDDWVTSILSIHESNQSSNSIDQDNFHSYFVETQQQQRPPIQGDVTVNAERKEQIVVDPLKISKGQDESTTVNKTSSLSSKIMDSVNYFSKSKSSEPKPTATKPENANNRASIVTVQNTNQSQENEKGKGFPKSSEKESVSSPSISNRIKESVSSFAKSKKQPASGTTPVEKSSLSKVLPNQKPVSSGNSKTVNDTELNDKSYLNMIWSLPQNLQLSFGLSKMQDSNVEKVAPLVESELVSESCLAMATMSLADDLLGQGSLMATSKKLEALCDHFRTHPQFRHLVAQHPVVTQLVQLKEHESPDIVAKANQALALIGYHRQPRGRGIRMLSIDGGGTRGLIAIEMMLRLEELCGRPLYQMFDLVVGSSTGALIAGMIFELKIPVAECKRIYLEQSTKVFSKSSWASIVKNMAQFDVRIFEEVVKKVVGEQPISDFSQDPSCPKIAITSTLTNVPRWQVYMFRSYNLPPGRVADYPGSCNVKAWEAVRASTSAPVYYREFQLGDNIFMDGGCLANNPTALGMHECRLLWPEESFQCILSLGNGRYDPYLNQQVKDSSLWQIVKGLPNGFIDSATDAEAIHQALKDSLPTDAYYRLCPYLSENYDLSEIKAEKIREMLNETNIYLDKNTIFLERIVKQLLLEKRPDQKLLGLASRLGSDLASKLGRGPVLPKL